MKISSAGENCATDFLFTRLNHYYQEAILVTAT